MLVHLDTSVLVDAFTGARRSLRQVESATLAGDILAFSAIVDYEWLRGARTQAEREAVRRLFGTDQVVSFGEQEARQRQANLAIAACAIEHGARLWTLNVGDFDDIPDLVLYRPFAR